MVSLNMALNALALETSQQSAASLDRACLSLALEGGSGHQTLARYCHALGKFQDQRRVHQHRADIAGQ